MKKLVTISVVLAMVLALAVSEVIADAKRYSDISEKLGNFVEVLNANKDDITVSEVREAYEKAYDEWEKTDGLSLAITNHNLIRALGEKFVYLDTYIKTDAYSDAYATAEAIIKTVNDLKREKYPDISNIF